MIASDVCPNIPKHSFLMMRLTSLRIGSGSSSEIVAREILHSWENKEGGGTSAPLLKTNPSGKRDGNDYWEIALTGHTDTQLPHSMQVPSSTFALPSTMLIASTGQFPTQVSQPTHASVSTFAFAIIHTSLTMMFE
jgi:hypothetical protein